MAVALALVMVLPIHLHAIAGVSRSLMARAVAEATAIWRDVGVQLEWHGDDDAPPSALRMDVGNAAGTPMESGFPLAWITFYDGVPEETIHVSIANAVTLFMQAQSIPQRRDAPAAMIDELVGRGVGRAIAHEIGHYLFRSTVHDETGVMGTNRTPAELFGTDRARFLLTPAERARLSAVLQRNRLAQRAPTPFE